MSAGKPYSLLWFVHLQGEAMKDFDLLTCTSLDSAMNFKRNGKKNITCPKQLNWRHLHSFHWKKIYLRCLKIHCVEYIGFTASNETLMVSSEGEASPTQNRDASRWITATRCQVSRSLWLRGLTGSLVCGHRGWGAPALESSLGMLGLSWLATTNLFFWEDLLYFPDSSSFYAVILLQILACRILQEP